ncbi:tRNA-specific adenosine deaminase [Candidatus Entotheonellaceae bacterium PAL068K]
MTFCTDAQSVSREIPLDHDWFMREALQQAEVALRTGDVPVGAIVVMGGTVIGRGRNRREELADPTAHAEIVALREAAQQLGSWRLTTATLYVTLEPCIMCIGAAVLSRIQCLVFGCADPKAGACGSQFDILGTRRLNHTFPVVEGVCQAEARALVSDFFQRLRHR